jgi:acyl carrier protein
MGLDTVEIVLRVEETFAVDLPDDELGSVATVGDLYRLLLSRLDGSYACLSSRAFYRVRKSMVEVLGVSRRSIRPSTELESVLARPSRRALWKRIERHAGLRFPVLREPTWSHWPLLLLSAGVYICLVYQVAFEFNGFRTVQMGLSIAVLGTLVGTFLVPYVAFAIYGATPFLRHELPAATVGELAREVLTLNYPKIKQGDSAGNVFDENEVWKILKEIIVDQLQVKAREVVPEAHFGRDLGAE